MLNSQQTQRGEGYQGGWENEVHGRVVAEENGHVQLGAGVGPLIDLAVVELQDLLLDDQT